jgi:3-oxoacyl-[acyl-carrier protein] reductase
VAEQRVAIVTGAAAGIGRAVALALAARGWGLVLGDRDTNVVEVAEQAGAAALGLPSDLTDDTALAALVSRACERGPLAAIVHCAALFPRLALGETRIADFDRVMAINLRVAVQLTLCGAREMTGGGALVFLTSGSGLLSAATNPFQRGFALYGASKAALDRWVAGVAGELAEAGVFASTLTPGAFVETPGLTRQGITPPPDAQTITADQVAQAVVRLVEDRSGRFAGERLSAARFDDGAR